MNDYVVSIQGDTVDSICYRYYGYSENALEEVYNANYGLSKLGPILPMGTKVLMPVINKKEIEETVNLWD